MKFNVASSILALYSLIGFIGIIYVGFDSNFSLLIGIVLYGLIPAYGAYGAWLRSRIAIVISLLFFISQCIRSIGTDSLLPNFAPITVSFPVGDFSNGQGYLIDFFAIFMVIFLAMLLKEVTTTKP